jgi:hypothetical protein
VLFELFPWVKVEFLAGVQAQETTGERALREQLERIERQLLQQGNVPLALPTLSSSGQPKTMAVPQFSLPVEDEEDTMPFVMHKKTSDDAGRTLLNTVLHLNS